MACIPAIVWGLVFYRKRPENRQAIVVTFLAGATAVFPILLYKYLWNYLPWINVFKFTNAFTDDYVGFSRIALLPLSVIFTFILVGVIEEVMKNFAMRISNEGFIKNIDDAIQFSIIAALGFSFTENIMYFYNIWAHSGTANLIAPFVFRSVFSSFAHLMFSGIFGYFYGLGLFASPILHEQLKSKRIDSFFEWIYRRRITDAAELYKYVQVTKGLLLAVVLHAFYNVFLELNWTFILIPFLAGGFLYVNYLFDKKNNHKEYNLVLEKP